MVEHAAVNRRVVSSSLTEAAKKEEQCGRSPCCSSFFVNFFRLALTVLRFGRRIAAVCTTLAWCAAEVVSSSLTEAAKEESSVDVVYAAFFFYYFFRLQLTVLCFGRCMAVVCTKLAWCAAECRQLLEVPKKKELHQNGVPSY